MSLEQFDTDDYHVETRPSTLRQMARLFRDILETVVPAALIAISINLFLAQATRVYGQSMEPSLHSNQRLVIEKISYNTYFRQFLNGPERGDVVVVNVPTQGDELLIKRVIGLPGDEIEIHHGKVYVNGQILNEPYLNGNTAGIYGPLRVSPLHIFVLGDNRNYSNDSRNFGTVQIDNVMGRAWFSYWPVDEIGFIE